MNNHTKTNDPNTMNKAAGIQKVATQIEGLDEILHGGLPAGRVTLVSGGPGSGKTLVGMEFLYHGAQAGDPGIFISFEETAESIRQNMLSLGWDLPSLEKAGKLFLMEGQVDPEAVVSGNFNLKGLLAIIDGKTREMGAKRIMIDALDVLMLLFNDPVLKQQQIFVLHNWLKKMGMTTIMTKKNSKGADKLPRDSYLDFMSDCVIYLDQRIKEQVNTKRIQVIKYRGSSYGSNEYPFLITDKGMFFNPISDMQLRYEISSQRLSSGHSAFDRVLGGGYLRGSCILISGATGVGKTSIASSFVFSACEISQKALYISFEESPDSLVEGMISVGIDLRAAIQKGSLRILSVMPESRGIEEHLFKIMTAIQNFQPEHIVVDAISACERIAGESAAFDYIVRLIHFCKKKGITIMLINQAINTNQYEISGVGISSIIDTVIVLNYKLVENATIRILQVLKSRGSKHSNRLHKLSLTGNGIQLDMLQCEDTCITRD